MSEIAACQGELAPRLQRFRANRRRCRLCRRRPPRLASRNPIEVVMARRPAEPDFDRLMELAGLEPATSWVRLRRRPSPWFAVVFRFRLVAPIYPRVFA